MVERKPNRYHLAYSEDSENIEECLSFSGLAFSNNLDRFNWIEEVKRKNKYTAKKISAFPIRLNDLKRKLKVKGVDSFIENEVGTEHSLYIANLNDKFWTLSAVETKRRKSPSKKSLS